MNKALGGPVVAAGDDGQGWQARKSAQMRTAILEAAIDCLGEHGYARLTTQLIADRAGVSRGAMLHHYATKMDLVAAVIDYVFYRRGKAFAERVAALSERQRVDELAGLDLLWESLSGRPYRAQLELAVAARTDPDLAALYLPKAEAFNARWREGILDLFPEWRKGGGRHVVAIDFVQAVMEGLDLNRATVPEDDRGQRVRALVAEVLHAVRAGKMGRLTP